MDYSQRGNILFLILLAVFLFVALSYAVTSSQKGGVKDASSETADSAAASIVQSGALFENAINRLRLTNACKDTEINFVNNTVGGYSNSNAPADKRCNVFDPAGGGAGWPITPNAWLDPYFIGNATWATRVTEGPHFAPNVQIIGLGTTTADGAGGDLVLLIPFLRDDVCKAINRKLGYATDIVSNGDFIDSAHYAGVYSSCAPSECHYSPTFTVNSVSVGPAFNSGCVLGRTWGSGNPEGGRGVNTYVRVLVAR